MEVLLLVSSAQFQFFYFESIQKLLPAAKEDKEKTYRPQKQMISGLNHQITRQQSIIMINYFHYAPAGVS